MNNSIFKSMDVGTARATGETERAFRDSLSRDLSGGTEENNTGQNWNEEFIVQRPATAPKCLVCNCTSLRITGTSATRVAGLWADRGDGSGNRRGWGCGNKGHSAEDRVGGWVIYGVLVSWYDGYGLHSRVGVYVVKVIVLIIFTSAHERVAVEALVSAVRVVIVISAWPSTVQKWVSVSLRQTFQVRVVV